MPNPPHRAFLSAGSIAPSADLPVLVRPPEPRTSAAIQRSGAKSFLGVAKELVYLYFSFRWCVSPGGGDFTEILLFARPGWAV